MNPFFSRDGQWVAFWNGRELYKVPVDGGGPVLLGEFGTMTGGDWDDEGNLVIGTGAPSTNGRAAVALNGRRRNTDAGACERRVVPYQSADSAGWEGDAPPGSRRAPGQDNSTVDVVSIADRARKTLARGVGSPRYLPSGHLVYTKKATMFAVPFDLERMEVRGTAVAVLDDVALRPDCEWRAVRRVTHRHARVPAARWRFQRHRAVARYDRQAGAAPGQARRVCRNAPRVARWQAHRDHH